MLPGQAGRARHGLQVQEHQRLLRVYGDALIHGVAAVGGDAVHADEPAVLAVHEAELAAALLDAGRAHGHVVRDGGDGTGIAHAYIALLARHEVHA